MQSWENKKSIKFSRSVLILNKSWSNYFVKFHNRRYRYMHHMARTCTGTWYLIKEHIGDAEDLKEKVEYRQDPLEPKHCALHQCRPQAPHFQPHFLPTNRAKSQPTRLHVSVHLCSRPMHYSGFFIGNKILLKIHVWNLKPVFRIHEILVKIRIRGFIALTDGSGFGSGSCSFRQWPSRQ